MGKAKLRACRLALAPSTGLGEEAFADDQDQQSEEEHRVLDQERMARTTETVTVAGQGNPRRVHVHGIKKWQGSKFWATGNEDDSSEESENEEATPTLVNEALVTGLTIDQLRQVEAELDTPHSSTTKVRTSLKESSISKQIVDTWIINRWNRGKSWTDPLPPPRTSPLRTLGYAIAKAKVLKGQNSGSLTTKHDRHRGLGLSESSSARSRHMPSPVGTSDKTSSRLDQMASSRNPISSDSV
jgi:hypothetical protein